MIINSKVITLSEAATMLNQTEQEVLRLSQYGYLEQSKPDNGRTRISLKSLERYARRSGITLVEAFKPSIERLGNITVQETKERLGFETEAAVHRLIQTGKLKAGFEGGAYVVNSQSLHDYMTRRN